jgi:hypothetical protein
MKISPLLILPLVFFPAPAGAAEPKAPPPPKAYHVRIRFGINAHGNARVVPYLAMMKDLRKAGFQRDPAEEVPPTEPEDPRFDKMSGSISASGLPALFRIGPIRAVLLWPQGAKLPTGKDERVRADIRLVPGRDPRRQRALHEQTSAVLQTVGFAPAVGYESRGYSRLLGSLPVGQLDVLLDGPDKLPAAADLPLMKHGSPVEVATVYPPSVMPLPGARPKPVALPEGQERIGPGLRALLGGPDRTVRMEVILAEPTPAAGVTWQAPLLRATSGLSIEDRMGPFVTVSGSAKDALALAKLPQVIGVRLPRQAQSSHSPPGSVRGGPARPVELSGLARLHTLGRRGKGTRIAVVDADFSGAQEVIGKELPADTELIDLTRQRNRNLQPEPYPAGAKGTGTQCALLVHKAAPEARLTLLRVDPASPGMLYEAARALNGEVYHSPALERTYDALENDRILLDRRRDALARERAAVLGNFDFTEEARKRREQYEKDQAQWDVEWKAFRQHQDRYFRLVRQIMDLKGVDVVASGLVWNEGYPVNGGGPLTRYLEDAPFQNLWVQAAGDVRGQAWSGLFRDVDGNRVMEFVPAGTPLPAHSWSHELNFLTWQADTGGKTLELPAGARLRFSVQWQEAHDDIFGRVGVDAYREPLAQVRLLLLRQPDPEGKSRPADDLEVVASSAGVPLRLRQTPAGAVYEQVLEFEVKKPGRYILQIEGRAPESTRPADAPTLPSLEKKGEIHPRLFVNTLAGPGRALLGDYATEEGTLGMPADARRAVTVGAADERGVPQEYSAQGPPHGCALLHKPDVVAYDQGEGTCRAVFFAAGLMAVSRGADVPLAHWRDHFPVRPGGLLRIPEGWPR